ncbi:MAG: hypothetical protein LBO78_02565 [Rickettsiales bacterium]|jgi:hypothetical protein|nr:hypothetical protein [Rickettsiales bacterium]
MKQVTKQNFSNGMYGTQGCATRVDAYMRSIDRFDAWVNIFVDKKMPRRWKNLLMRLQSEGVTFSTEEFFGKYLHASVHVCNRNSFNGIMFYLAQKEFMVGRDIGMKFGARRLSPAFTEAEKRDIKEMDSMVERVVRHVSSFPEDCDFTFLVKLNPTMLFPRQSR